MRFSLCAVLLLTWATSAHAQHDHHHVEEHPPTSVVAAGASLVAASFDTPLYIGNYQGIIPSLRWSNARFGAMVNASAYRLDKNGASRFGLGDLGVHGQARVWSAPSFETGASLAVTVPTGSGERGFGMGHVMLMPAGYAGWSSARFRVAGSLGYSRALGNGMHDHGPWPLVSPMMRQELSWNAGGELLLSRRISTGVRASGGIPLTDADRHRAVVAGRVAWRAGRVDSSFELQAGIAGDPFTLRGLVSTALSFL
jgi:hypothetical protein